MTTTTKSRRRHCENCNGFLRNEPDEIVMGGISYGEDGPDGYDATEIRTCRGCGHDNETTTTL